MVASNSANQTTLIVLVPSVMGHLDQYRPMQETRNRGSALSSPEVFGHFVRPVDPGSEGEMGWRAKRKPGRFVLQKEQFADFVSRTFLWDSWITFLHAATGPRLSFFGTPTQIPECMRSTPAWLWLPTIELTHRHR